MRRLLRFAMLPAAVCVAQTAPPQPAFEVAAIKPSKSDDGSSSWHSGKGRITMDNLSVKAIIMAAYHLRDYQISGPPWMSQERYHIDAKAETKVEDDQLMSMLQTLLADRFKLTVHREKKEMTAYALVTAKGGLKIHPVEGEGSSSRSNGGKLTAKHVSMAKLAEILSRQLDRPVVDETGAAGGYDFTLEWANERMQKASETDGGPPAGPTIFTALPEQLGLKLEARKVPVDMLVIDRVERPSEN